MLEKVQNVGSNIRSSFWGGVSSVGAAASAVRNYLPSKETVSNVASVVGKTGYYGAVSYGRLVADMFVVKEAMDFLFTPKKEDEDKQDGEFHWTDYVGMGIAVVSSTYLMLTVYNIRRKKAEHEELETPGESHNKAMQILEFLSIFGPLSLVAYGGSYFFVKDFITRNPIAIQTISSLAGVAVGYDSYVLHESHHNAEQSTYALYKALNRRAKAWFLMQAASLLIGHGAEAYLQSEGGLRAFTDNTQAAWAHYFRASASVGLAIPVIYFATNTELHSILMNQNSNRSTYFAVKMGGGIAAIVHTCGPAVGFLEFISAGKCGMDTSWDDITPECDSSFAHMLDFWPKVGLLAGSVIAFGLMGGKGFLAATLTDVNEVAERATEKLRLSEFRICHWNKNRDEEHGLVDENPNYGAITQTNGK